MSEMVEVTLELPREAYERVEEIAQERGLETLILATVVVYLFLVSQTEGGEEKLRTMLSHLTLDDILATIPAEQVIDFIEKLDPPWKNDLPPWKAARPGEKIPWYAVYVLKDQPATPEAIAWARKRLAELRAAGDVP